MKIAHLSFFLYHTIFIVKGSEQNQDDVATDHQNRLRYMLRNLKDKMEKFSTEHKTLFLESVMKNKGFISSTNLDAQ